MRLALVVFLLCLVPGFSLAPTHTEVDVPVIDRVSITARSDGAGYVMRLHSSAQIPAYSEPRRTSGSEIEILIFNTELARSVRQDDPAGPVRAYDLVRERNHIKLRLTLDPSSPVIATAYRDRGTADLLIALDSRGDRPVASAGPSASPPTRTSPSPPSPGASDPSSAQSTSGERWRLDTIVIDAGHGGRDHGAVANGVREKDVVLAVSKKLGRYIEENLGVKVIYTRTDDRFIELRQRGRIANEVGGKLFISIHANSARNRTAYGTETFFLGPHRTEAARRVMEKENQVVMMESDPDHYQSMTEEALIRQTLAYSSYMRKSEELAEHIERQFADRVGRNSRGVKQAGFYVLWSASMPAVLVELGFLTNAREAAFLNSEEGQTYLASGIFRAVRDFKEQYERGLNLVRTD